MKRRDLIKLLNEMGCVSIRHGGKLDWYPNPKSKQSQPIPRHAEINENLVRSIIRN
jgi:mRNA interferase HicA